MQNARRCDQVSAQRIPKCPVRVQLIQSMILPAVDSMKNTVLQKGMSAIPGIGSGLNSAMTMVIGSAVVIKNSIGAVGILVLIVIIVPPVIEITAVVLTYLLAGS